jgi:alpha-tubulin suppressor-like RCC1 family protein
MRIASVAVGSGFTVVVTEAGAAYSFGMGGGRLDHGRGDETEHLFVPKRIEALDRFHVVTVAAGGFQALALTRCGRVYSWSRYGGFTPVHGLGLDSDDSAGGDPSSDMYVGSHVITALLGKRVRAVAAGPNISCAVTDAGALYTWGDNEHGNLGQGDLRLRDKPKPVRALDGICVVGVSLHDKQTLALAADGSVYAFGVGPGLGLGRGGENGEVDEAKRIPRRIPNLSCLVPR